MTYECYYNTILINTGRAIAHYIRQSEYVRARGESIGLANWPITITLTTRTACVHLY